ncbi:hypothetical protein [Polynucleobacter sp. AM-7D1]|uniref:hypothetical protein n=1 Tax=Polynucleobacter sp. AM-7D1 TaxID=2689102 RepID=UPI001BFEC047|nr:hypothetical protein [Polynucleobacter sp. AM-7D1]QWE27951.1 hypothetical protein GQ359_05895 [Polynucleobacter sp. AM-7D1]
MKQQNYRIRSIAISSALGLMLSACGTNPVQQVQNQQQDDYRAQAKVAKQAISEAPDWMSKLPKESGVIYENGTAISSDFSMADLKAKTMAYVKICTGAGGKVRSQMKMYRADNDAASVEQSELSVRSLCPDVDISGVETVEMKHVAEGNRIRTYVLVALPLGSKNVAKSAKEIQNRSGDAFKELDGITRDAKDTRDQNTSAAPVAPVATPIAPNRVEQISKTPAPILSTPSAQAEPARVEQVMPPLSPASSRPFVAPATKPDGSLLESVKAIGNDAVIVQGPNGADKQIGLLGSKNPEYVARRAEALQKPGAVIGQVSVE